MYADGTDARGARRKGRKLVRQDGKQILLLISEGRRLRHRQSLPA